MTIDLGISFHREEPARTVIERAQQAEEAGWDEFWIIEDCFFTAGVSLVSAALATTSEITVGLGIAPVVARTAAMTAMEFATLASLAPGRFHAGLGHGVQEWMAQMGVRPASPLTALDETMRAVRQLLHGERLTVHGDYVTLVDVALDPAPAIPPLLSAGVRGPKSMAVAGQVADGVILADFVSPTYVEWVREKTGNPDHRITVFSSLAVGPAEAAEGINAGIRHFLAEVAPGEPQSLTTAPFWDELKAKADATSWVEATRAMPDEWLDQLCAAGSPDRAAAYVQVLADAGADAVSFFPNPFGARDHVAWASEHVLPTLR